MNYIFAGPETVMFTWSTLLKHEWMSECVLRLLLFWPGPISPRQPLCEAAPAESDSELLSIWSTTVLEAVQLSSLCALTAAGGTLWPPLYVALLLQNVLKLCATVSYIHVHKGLHCYVPY